MPLKKENHEDGLKRNVETHLARVKQDNEAEVTLHKQVTNRQVDDKLKALEENNLIEIEKIRQENTYKIKEINKATWIDNQELLKQQDIVTTEEKEKVEAELDKIKDEYEERLQEGKQKTEKLESKADSAEYHLSKINETLLSEQSNIVKRSGDVKRQLAHEKHELEMEHIIKLAESSTSNLEAISRLEEKHNTKLEQNFEQSIQHRKTMNENAIQFQQALVNAILLNMESSKIKDVNNCITNLKNSKNEVMQYYIECIPVLLAIERIRRTNTVNMKPKSSDIKLVAQRLQSFSKQLGKISNDVVCLGTNINNANVAEKLEQMTIQITNLKSDVILTQNYITDFLSYLRNKEVNWKDDKVNNFQAQVEKISTDIDSLPLLKNRDAQEQLALISKQINKPPN